MARSKPSNAVPAAPSFLTRLWALFCSVKLGVALLIALAIAAIVGTFIESLSDTETAQRQVYHAPWFIALLALTTINLFSATWRTTLLTLRAPWLRPVPRSADICEKQPEVRLIEGPVDPARLQDALERRVGPVSAEGQGFFAQRGLIQRWGSLVTHIGMFMCLIGGIYLSVSAHLKDGTTGGAFLPIGEGMTRDWYLVRNPSGGMSRERMEFVLRLHDFDADMFPGTQIPRAFTSTIELVTPDGHSSMHQVNMNVALQWRGWKFSQSGYSILDRSLNQSSGRDFLNMDGQEFIDLFEDGRMTIELIDNSSGQRWPLFDTGPEALVTIPQSDLWFETVEGGQYRVLRGQTVIAQGELQEGSSPNTSDIHGSDGHDHVMADDFDADTVWTIRIDALYPNYRRAPEGDSTEGNEMVNPAIRWTLFADGEAVGSDLSFLSEQFRDMHFANLPIHVTFEGHDLAENASYAPGDSIALEISAVDNRSGARTQPLTLGVGEVFALPISPVETEPGADVASGESITPIGDFTASVVGRQPGAYSYLGVMRESQRLKFFFYISFVLFGLGPYLAFTSAHCQIWAWVDKKTGKAVIGGRVRGRKGRLPVLLDRIAKDLQEGNQ